MKPIHLSDPSYTLAATVKGSDMHVPLTAFRHGKWHTGDGVYGPRELTAPRVLVHDSSVDRVDLPRALRVAETVGVHLAVYLTAWVRDADIGKWGWESAEGVYPYRYDLLSEPEFVTCRSVDDPRPVGPLPDDLVRRVILSHDPNVTEDHLAKATEIVRAVQAKSEAVRAARIARRRGYRPSRPA